MNADNNIAIARMQTDIEYIKQGMVEIKEFMKTSREIFSTKEEHTENKKAIELMQQEHARIASRIMWSSISTILTVLSGFFLFILKKLGII